MNISGEAPGIGCLSLIILPYYFFLKMVLDGLKKGYRESR